MTSPIPTLHRERSDHVLDHAVWETLVGEHARFAVGSDRARRYASEVAPFAALVDVDDDRAWADLGDLYAPGEVVVLSGPTGFAAARPSTWQLDGVIPGVQLVATDTHVAATDDESVQLGPDDVAEATDLVARTEPGPFRPRTRELGTYLGIRRGGRLVAMAGERLHPPGWTEISAVCTDPAHRRQGLATRLVAAVAQGIRERGETPFLHTGAANTRAIDLYLSLGFELRREVDFVAVRLP